MEKEAGCQENNQDSEEVRMRNEYTKNDGKLKGDEKK